MIERPRYEKAHLLDNEVHETVYNHIVKNEERLSKCHIDIITNNDPFNMFYYEATRINSAMKLFMMIHIVGGFTCIYRELYEVNYSDFGKLMKALEVLSAYVYFFVIIYAIQINFAWNGIFFDHLEPIARSS